MKKTLAQKTFFIFVTLMVSVLFACSDDKAGDAPAVEKHLSRALATPMPQTDIERLKQNKEQNKEQNDEELERLLKIGIIGPETGADAVYGLHVVEGVLAAAKRFNAQGGIDGKEIEILHLDNEGNPGLTAKAVSYLIRQNVVAIFSSPTGWSTFVPVHRVNDSKTLFISIGSRRHIERSGPYVFRVALSDEHATDDLIKYTTETLGYVNYAMVTSSNYDYSLDVSALFKKALAKHGGILKVDTDSYDVYTGKRNLQVVVDAIKNTDALQGVIFTGAMKEGVLLAKELKKAGLKLPIIGDEDLFSADFLKAGDAVSGSLLYATYSPDNDSPKMDEFKKDYGKDNPDRFSALAYDSFMLLAEAIKQAGSTKSSKVREALINIKDYEGVTGKTSFTSEGISVKQTFIYSVKKGEQGEGFVVLE